MTERAAEVPKWCPSCQGTGYTNNRHGHSPKSHRVLCEACYAETVR